MFRGGSVLDMGSVETITGDVLDVHQARSGFVALFGKDRHPVRWTLLHGSLDETRSTFRSRRT